MELENLTSEQQERMCELCALHVFDGPVNTNQWNLCEGSRCDIALEYLLEELVEEKREKLKYLLIIS
jgi:hypothetical protein